MTLGFFPTISPRLQNFHTPLRSSSQLSDNTFELRLQKTHVNVNIASAPNRCLDLIIPPAITFTTLCLATIQSRETSCHGNIIGYLTNTSDEISTPNYRECLKMIYVFFALFPSNVSTDAIVELKLIQCFASLAC